MSGICGIWNRDGGPVFPQTLSVMTSRLAHRGPDGERSFLRGSLGMSYQKLAVTPESLPEVQPAEHGSGVVLVWDGRLDNRDHLGASLPGLGSELPDTAFVLAAYHHWGEAFISHLIGDFALALFDLKHSHLVLARDAMGARTLYYTQEGDEFLFASEIKALLAHPQVQAEPHDQMVAEWLYRIPDFSDATRTFFRGIQCVEAGTAVRVTLEGVTRHRYWDLDVHTVLRLRNYDDYVAAYRECFQRAVQRRLRSAFPVAIAVSGGLDSSSIYCTAKEIGPAPIGGKPIIGVVIAAKDPLADEEPFQRLVEQKYGTELLRIPLQSVPLTTAEKQRGDLARYSEGPYLKWQVWRDLSRLMCSHGARVFFSGMFGDHLLTNPHFILDLLFRGRLASAWRHTRDYFSWGEGEGVDNRYRLAELKAILKGYLVPDKLRPAYHGMRRRFSKGSIPNRPWFSPRLTEAAARIERERSYLNFPGSRMHAKIIYQYLHAPFLNLKLDMESKMDAEFPCDTVMPFRDRDLVQLVVSLPGEVAYRSGSRGIHRDAMRGILPEAVRLRLTKANFDDPARRGALEDLALLRSSLPTGAAQQLGYLAEGKGLEQALGSLEAHLATVPGAGFSWATNDLVALEEWCTAFFGASKGTGRV